ncbi:YolD-like family protein [Staphylococcus cohnii]|uniref:YolD-like family protein n=1 Tax=Staphylococcus cohnii TaxID=29382 RepID=UPI003D7CD550
MFYNIGEVIIIEKIHPNLPEPYCYEHDYRKIPREYLNPHIPQGRGMVKWQAFKTLPEQYEQLEQYIQDQNKIDMPILSDEQVQILNDKLNMKIEHNAQVNVTYWKNGYTFSIQGYIKKVDILESTLTITNDKGHDAKKISLLSIINLD